MYSLWQRVRSLRHRFSFGLSERLRWSRGPFHESPALVLPGSSEQAERIAALQSRYQVKFEARLAQATSLNNYEYLDLLDRLWQAAGLAPPRSGVLCDVGCANFCYAAALQAFFRPASLVGVEIEGYRRYRDGHTRIDYAAGYLALLPQARFVVADYAGLELAADVITAWFPFVTPQAILAWRLPLSFLTPVRLFARVRANLRPGGLFVMANHGLAEAAIAADLCAAAGLTSVGRHVGAGPLNAHRLAPAVLSAWRVEHRGPLHSQP
jgi:SAM-dependent methyltransferase